LGTEWSSIAARFGVDRSAVEVIWSLVGTRAESILAEGAAQPAGFDAWPLPGTLLPRGFVRWVIANEWAITLEDLVERRLVLLYHPNLTRSCLEGLARLLVEAGRLPADKMVEEIERTIRRLETHFGKRIR
jgi:glycerol-3-phosphate dehydrogenase